ncbi:hypothetical protein [Azospirillum melinis]
MAKDKDTTRTAPIAIRTFPEVKAAAEKAAAADGRTLSQWVERALIARLKSDGLLSDEV